MEFYAKWSKAQCELTPAGQGRGLTPWTPAALAQGAARYQQVRLFPEGKRARARTPHVPGGWRLWEERGFDVTYIKCPPAQRMLVLMARCGSNI